MEIEKEQNTIKVEKQKEEINFNTYLVLLWKYKTILLTVLISSSILAYLFSSPFFITPLFKSVAVVYPSNIAPYSNESMTEQMLEMMNSLSVKDSVIFNQKLVEHYGFDKNSKNYLSLVRYEYDEKINVERTDFEAIRIKVFDKDPEKAKDIADQIIFCTDALIRNVQSKKLNEVVYMYSNGLKNIKEKIDSVDSAILKLREENNFVDFEIQLEQLSRNYYNSLSTTGKGLEEMRQTMNTLKTKGTIYQLLESRAKKLKELYAEQEAEYLKTIRDVERNFTYTNIISKPMAADQKSYPVRWLIVLISAISATLLALITIIYFESKNNGRLSAK